jgi:hypothetical protein
MSSSSTGRARCVGWPRGRFRGLRGHEAGCGVCARGLHPPEAPRGWGFGRGGLLSFCGFVGSLCVLRTRHYANRKYWVLCLESSSAWRKGGEKKWKMADYESLSKGTLRLAYFVLSTGLEEQKQNISQSIVVVEQ